MAYQVRKCLYLRLVLPAIATCGHTSPAAPTRLASRLRILTSLERSEQFPASRVLFGSSMMPSGPADLAELHSIVRRHLCQGLEDALGFTLVRARGRTGNLGASIKSGDWCSCSTLFRNVTCSATIRSP